MAADRGVMAGIGHNSPCSLGSGGGGDNADLIEQVAADMWESRQDGVLDYCAWADASDYWQRGFRELAGAAVASLKTRIASQNEMCYRAP